MDWHPLPLSAPRTAQKVCPVDLTPDDHMRGYDHAHLYRLDPPLNGATFVVGAVGSTHGFAHETWLWGVTDRAMDYLRPGLSRLSVKVFPNRRVLDGSRLGVADVAFALGQLGYSIDGEPPVHTPSLRYGRPAIRACGAWHYESVGDPPDREVK